MSGCCNSTTAAAATACSTPSDSSAPSWVARPAISIEPRQHTLGTSPAGAARSAKGGKASSTIPSCGACPMWSLRRRGHDVTTIGRRCSRSVADWRPSGARSANRVISSPRGPGSRPSTRPSGARRGRKRPPPFSPPPPARSTRPPRSSTRSSPMWARGQAARRHGWSAVGRWCRPTEGIRPPSTSTPRVCSPVATTSRPRSTSASPHTCRPSWGDSTSATRCSISCDG